MLVDLGARYVSSAHLGLPLVDMNQATLDLAIRCINYLCQRHHDSSLSSQEVSENVLTGQYSFDAFATRMWFELTCQHLHTVKAPGFSAALMESIKMLWECRRIGELEGNDPINEKDSQSDSQPASEHEFVDDLIPEGVKQEYPLLYHFLRSVSQFRRTSFLYTGEVNQGMSEFCFPYGLRG